MRDKTVYYYKYQTRRGVVKLWPEPNGRYQVVYDDEGLGSYHSPEAAADDVSGGHTFSPSNGVDFEELGVPGDLTEWEKKLFATFKLVRPA